MRIALPVSEFFNQAKNDLFTSVGAVSVRKEGHLFLRYRNKDILFHANGFIDDNFNSLINNGIFLRHLNKSVKLFSFDLGPSCLMVGCSHSGYVAKSAVLTPKQILKIAGIKIKKIRTFFNGAVSVENLDYHPSGAYESVCEPEFIKRFVKELGVYLTLDIGHLEVTCNNLSIDEYSYLDALPLSKVVEIHLTRSIKNKDSHLLPKRKEYKLLEYALKKSRPRYVLIEYYKDYNGIIGGNKQLITFLKKNKRYEN